jgi:DNA-binding NtrC family response regulator
VVDGVAVPARCEVSAEAIGRGVLLELAGSVALLLHLRRPPRLREQTAGFVGDSNAIDVLRDDIARVAALEMPVLIGGETGSGKEHVARALHEGSGRRGGPFIAINMATLAPAMAAAQLFGHVRGAFTGADRAHAGLFEQAEGGTLFLDEIADTPAEVQAMLLRALETSEVQPVGAEHARRVNVRVIAASDADLTAEVELRPQLYFRLAGYRITVPPLRDRLDDLGRLLAAFVARELSRLPDTGHTPWLPAAVFRSYLRYPWPGNVRELANLARHLAIHGRAGALPLEIASWPLGGSAERSEAGGRGSGGLARDAERSEVFPGAVDPEPSAVSTAPRSSPRLIADRELIATLAAQRWKIGATAAALGVSKTTLYGLIEKCPAIRKARDLSREEILACHAELGGDLDAMSEQLQVSKRGLQLRIKELEP